MKLYELEDLEIFPALFRNMQTEFLSFTSGFLKIYNSVPPILLKINPPGNNLFIDLCSGAAFPAIQATSELRKRGFKLICCDKYPNLKIVGKVEKAQNVEYLSEPVDILNLPKNFNATFLIFNSLHHFKIEENKTLIKRLADKRAAFLFAEPIQPNFTTFIKVLFMTTLGHLLICPFIKPFRIERLIFTYLLPLNLIFTCFDGLISVIRSYKTADYKNLKAFAQKEGYTTEIGKRSYRFGHISYISGQF